MTIYLVNVIREHYISNNKCEPDECDQGVLASFEAISKLVISRFISCADLCNIELKLDIIERCQPDMLEQLYNCQLDNDIIVPVIKDTFAKNNNETYVIIIYVTEFIYEP